MNIRKRLLALILAAACMTSVAHASEVDGSGSLDFSTSPESPTANIYGKYQPAPEPTAVYHVTLSWPDLTFKYKTKGNRIWYPATHQYFDGDVTYEWDVQKLKVHAENKSNRSVTVKGEWQDGENTYGLNILVGNGSFTLDSADSGLNTGSDINLTAIPKNTTPDFTTPSGQEVNIGTLTLTVSATESP